ncbi:MAG: zinc-binding dehydrogenase [Rhodoferax sp.]|nr:zinc-binding dehydrogenase [Rhodoferax sp.]
MNTPSPSSQPLPTHMHAMLTLGHGGYEQLAWRTVPLPVLQNGEVLLQVLAAGINNTDINTRVGWYGAGWQGATAFPLIQGADCCGRVVAWAVGGAPVCASSNAQPRGAAVAAYDGTGQPLAIGQRVLVRSCMRVAGFGSLATRWLGTDCDGAFAQYLKAPAREVFAIHSDCDWSDAELASLPCAWGTAENMLHRAGVGQGEQVWVNGASGGVGSAAVQLALRRGTQVTALTSRSKRAEVEKLGAHTVLCREDSNSTWAQRPPADVVVDNVGGAGFADLLQRLRRGGRYVSSGAIAGAEVALDLRTLYLRDIRLIGCTAWDEAVFPNLLRYIQRHEIRPVVAACYPLQDLVQAQQDFLAKRHTGKLVLVP